MPADLPTPTAGVSRLVAGVAVLGAVVLLAGLTATTQVVDAEDLATVVASTSPGAVVVLADGEVPAAEGTDVPAGARVRTAAGAVVLRTADRTTSLAPRSTVRVLDGARQRLERGSALVDASAGPALDVDVEGAARVEVAERAVVRLDTLPLMRVAAYRGEAAVRPAGRRSTTAVDTLHQVRVPAGALPGRVTPLELVQDDAWEAVTLASVVGDDAELRGLASDLEVEGGPALRMLPASLTAGRSPAGLAEYALATALASDGDRVRDRVLDELLEGRRLGGSWGVVIRLAGTDLARATSYLELLMPVDIARVALATAVDAGTDVLPLVLPLPPLPVPVPVPTAVPTRAPVATPSGSPSPPASPGPEVPTPVRDLLDAVTGLLPSLPPLLPPVRQEPAAPQPTPTRAPLLEVDLRLPPLLP